MPLCLSCLTLILPLHLIPLPASTAFAVTSFYSVFLFQAVWLDVSEESVKAAESLGMTAVNIGDMSAALKEIEKFTDIKVMHIYLLYVFY